MASEREHWIDVDVDEKVEDPPSEAVADEDDDDDDVELHGQFFE